MTTKKQLELEVTQLRKDETILHICMNAAIRGEVKWFRGRRGYRLGLVRPASPTGGYAIVEWTGKDQQPSASAYYLEDYASDIRRVTQSIGFDDDRAAQLELIQEALRARDRAIEESSKPASVPGGAS